jgi:Family of unknown function (DUF6263)
MTRRYTTQTSERLLVAALAITIASAGLATPARALQPGGSGRIPSTRTTEISLLPRFVVGATHKFDLDLSDKEILPPAPLPPPGKKPGTPKPTQEQPPKASTFRQQVGITLRVESLDKEGNATLLITLDSFKMSGDGPAGKVEFDSATLPDAQDPMDALFRSITAMKMRATVDRRGEVTGITPEGTGSGVGSLIAGNVTGGDFMRTLVGPIFSPRPGKASASVGESWTEESQMKASAGDWTLVTTKNLRSVSGNKATIDIRGHVKVEPGSIGGTPGANAKSETVQTGQAEWDAEAGMLNSLNMTMKSEVGLLGALGNLGSLGDLIGGVGGIDAEDGAQSKPSKHETTIKIKRSR